MDRYIGLDAHASSCTAAVVGPSGRRLQAQVLETSARALVEFLKTLPKPRHLCRQRSVRLSPGHTAQVLPGVGDLMERKNPLDDEPFSYRETKDGRVFIAFRGRVVTTLAGAAARKFVSRVTGADSRQSQLAMAKATGHFKRGTERSQQ